jgi:CHASE3 domain sensor protein
MYSEARKLHLIEEVIKLKSDDALNQIERILKNASASKPVGSAAQLAGKISKEDIELMEKAIAEGCEQINPDDWK